MVNNNIIHTAIRTINSEAKAISVLADYVNEDFEKAISLIHACKGRVVISGIGKSAIVAQKIVSSLNSTGTPSLFLHSADAIHGDIGTVQKDDIVMIVSNSGESPEIKVLVPLIKNFKNTLIAMCGNMQSHLAKNEWLALGKPTIADISVYSGIFYAADGGIDVEEIRDRAELDRRVLGLAEQSTHHAEKLGRLAIFRGDLVDLLLDEIAGNRARTLSHSAVTEIRSAEIPMISKKVSAIDGGMAAGVAGVLLARTSTTSTFG